MGNARSTGTPADKFRAALDLYDVGLKLKYQNLRRSQPHASEAEIQEQFRRWLFHPPGAEFGDAPGRPVSWAERGADLARNEPAAD